MLKLKSQGGSLDNHQWARLKLKSQRGSLDNHQWTMLKLKSQGGSLENDQWTRLKLKAQGTPTFQTQGNYRVESATCLLSVEEKHKK